ncbi:MAG: tRNA dimethylallyltransferase [Dehalococcoidia bacterium]|nr:tRNA dimethylallyltransferase [Dehalococcoidia bacterium]
MDPQPLASRTSPSSSRPTSAAKSNGDSRQVYRGMDIGTAKPSLDARRKVRHHLYDIAEPSESFSLARYVNEARAALNEIWSRGSFAWLVGRDRPVHLGTARSLDRSRSCPRRTASPVTPRIR